MRNLVPSEVHYSELYIGSLKNIFQRLRAMQYQKEGEKLSGGEVMEKEGMEIGKGRVGVVDFP